MIKDDKILREYIEAVKISKKAKPIIKKKYKELFTKLAEALRDSGMDELSLEHSDRTILGSTINFARDTSPHWLKSGGAVFPWDVISLGWTHIWLGSYYNKDSLIIGEYPLEAFEDTASIVEDIKKFAEEYANKLKLEAEAKQ